MQTFILFSASFWGPVLILAASMGWFIYLLRHLRVRASTGPKRTVGSMMLGWGLSMMFCVASAHAVLSLHFMHVTHTEHQQALNVFKSWKEIGHLEGQCRNLVGDAGVVDMAELLPDIAPEQWKDLVPDLLQNGSSSTAAIEQGLKKRLKSGCCEVTADPWGRPYVYDREPFMQETGEVIRICSLGRDGVPSIDDVTRDSISGMDQDIFYWHNGDNVNHAPLARLYTMIFGRPWAGPLESYIGQCKAYRG